MEVAHRERFHTLLLQLAGRGGDRLLVQRRDDVSGRIEPLRDTEA